MRWSEQFLDKMNLSKSVDTSSRNTESISAKTIIQEPQFKSVPFSLQNHQVKSVSTSSVMPMLNCINPVVQIPMLNSVEQILFLNSMNTSQIPVLNLKNLVNTSSSKGGNHPMSSLNFMKSSVPNPPLRSGIPSIQMQGQKLRSSEVNPSLRMPLLHYPNSKVLIPVLNYQHSLSLLPGTNNVNIKPKEEWVKKREAEFEQCPICLICGEEFSWRSSLEVHIQNVHDREENEKTKKFQCQFCEKVFTDTTLLEQHIWKHLGLKTYTCSICGKALASDRILVRHKINHSKNRTVCSKKTVSEEDLGGQKLDQPDGVYHCITCNKNLLYKTVYEKHMWKEHGLKKYKCNQCDKRFVFQHSLSMHEKSHGDDRPFVCGTCGKAFKYSNNLKNHVMLHDRVGNQCLQCGNQYSSSEALLAHIARTHPSNRKNSHKKHDSILKKDDKSDKTGHESEKGDVAGSGYHCSTCNRDLLHRTVFDTHMWKEHREKVNKCKQCDKKFVFLHSLKMHEKTHGDDRPFVCGTCGKAFKYKNNLKNHVMLHDKVINECYQCGNRYSCRGTLVAHIAREHSDNWRHTCNVCGKRCVNKLHLEAHVLHHQGEKPFKCDFCDKWFVSRKNRNAHHKRHASEEFKKTQEVTCNICNKILSCKKQLQPHIQAVHLNLRPFQCYLCDKAFKDKAALLSHERNHENQKPFQCSECGKWLNCRRGLRLHLTWHEKRDDTKTDTNIDIPEKVLTDAKTTM